MKLLALVTLVTLAVGVLALGMASTARAETSATGPADVIKSVKADLAEREGVNPDKIEVLRVDAVTWRDGCMGVYQPGIYCTMALVPGYAVWLGIGDDAWRYHTNASGSVIIQAAGPYPAAWVPFEPTPPGAIPGGYAVR